jgi:hemerythrin
VSLMTWSDEYCIGVSIIDQQHKKLVKLLNQLHEGLLAHREEESLTSILTELVNYTDWHFLTEERLMRNHRYHGYEAHQKEHETLTRKVLEFQRTFQLSAPTIAVEVMDFLKSWLANHILQTDKLLGSFFKEKGVR